MNKSHRLYDINGVSFAVLQYQEEKGIPWVIWYLGMS